MTETPNLERAVKDNKGKPMLALFPMRALQWAGKAFTFGASKYAPYNWAKGLPHSELMDACLRHLTDYWAGEDNDPQSGLPHLAHGLCCIAMLLESKVRGIGTDDRWTWNAEPAPCKTLCKSQLCNLPARVEDGIVYPFCAPHEKQKVDLWHFCMADNCNRWVCKGHNWCSQHEGSPDADFLGGLHP
jgi:hypothetical protein